MSIHYRAHAGDFLIVGHTYPHREALRSLGAIFDRDLKAWRVPAANHMDEQLNALCRSFGGGRLDAETPQRIDSDKPAPVEMLPKDVAALRVSELLAAIQMKIALAYPQSVWIIGEIQNFQRRGKAIYWQLSEAKSADQQGTLSISAVMWTQVWTKMKADTSRYGSLADLLADGLEIRALCQVGLYRDRGSISLSVLDIDPQYSLGALALSRERILKELRQAGLDRKNKQLNLSRFPLRIGLISADDSRAKSDFLDQLSSYGYPGHILFCDARMQGEQAVSEVLSALEALRQQHCDLVVITRGGGSAADLRWFDDRSLALTIAHYPIPVLAAIGHHDDVSIAEEIAFRREKTPTAAADFVINTIQDTNNRLKTLVQSMATSSDLSCQRARSTLQSIAATFESAIDRGFLLRQNTLMALMNRVDSASVLAVQHGELRIERIQQRMMTKVESYISERRLQLERLTGKLRSIDPTPWMAEGWTQLSKNGKRIKDSEQMTVGDVIEARLIKAKIELKVASIT